MSEQHSSPEPVENPYSIKRAEPVVSHERADQVQHVQRAEQRKQHLPTMYGMWWMATLVFFVLAFGLGGYHALTYQGYDPFSLGLADLQDKFVFMSLSAALLGSLFLVWVLQNTAKGLTSSKPDPEASYNNVYAVMICLLIVGSMKMTSDVMAESTDARSGGNLTWLRTHAYGNPETEAAKTDAGTAGVDEKAVEERVSPFAKQAEEPAVVSLSPSGRNLPQAKPEVRSVHGGTHTAIRMGDPTKSVMAASMRTFQEAAGRAKRAELVVQSTPQPDLASVTMVGPLEAVAEAHLAAFETQLELSRVSASLPEIARLRMLEAGSSVERAEEQVGSLVSLLSLDTAVTLATAKAAVHGARAAYAGFLVQQFGGWVARNGSLHFEDAKAGARAAELRATIGQRELELKAAKYDAVSG